MRSSGAHAASRRCAAGYRTCVTLRRDTGKRGRYLPTVTRGIQLVNSTDTL